MRLDGVEIKVSLSDRQVAKALEVLELDGNGEPRRAGFIEDTTVGVALPLFHQGVVLRAPRRATAGGSGSRRDTVEEARAAQAGLEQAMGVLGLERDDQHASKTERVLAHLVGLEP